MRKPMYKAGMLCRASVAFVFFLSGIAVPQNIDSQSKLTRRILILNEGTTWYPSVNIIDDGIRSGLDRSPYHHEIYREYMDTILFPDPADQQRFRDFFVAKYRNRRPDVIITVGPTPLKFMQDIHKKIFPGVAIVFCQPNGSAPGSPELDSNFTGVENDMAAGETLDVALRLKADTKHVVITGGTSLYDRQQEHAVREQLRGYESRVDISYLTNLAMPDLLAHLRHLPNHTIVIHTSIGQDAAGTHFLGATQAGPMIAAAANAPVFSLFDVYLNHGEVGGYVSNLSEQGRMAGIIALRLLNGHKPQQIGRVPGVNTYMFDWRALKRWGMQERNLPPGSVVINRVPTVWESYRWYILGGLSLILMEAFLLFTLLWNRAKRRKVENELGITYDRLRMAVEGGRFVGWDFDISAGTNRWFGDLEGMFGIRADTYVAQRDEFCRRVHPDDLDSVARAIDKAKQNRDRYIAEFRVRRDDGTTRWVIARGQFYYSSDGTAQRMLGLALDITERKLAEEALNNVSRRLIQAQEKERIRIARELHDDINQRLALLQIEVHRLRDEPSASQADIRERLERIRVSLSETSYDVQALSHRLHSSKLEYLGLATACRSLCRDLSQGHQVKIEFQTNGIPAALPQELSVTLFRVLQECLQNAIKYSHAESIQVQLHGSSGEIYLAIRDNGTGFDVDAAMRNHGLGLISMRERVMLVKGMISIQSAPMRGTEINVRVPIILAGGTQKVSSAA